MSLQETTPPVESGKEVEVEMPDAALSAKKRFVSDYQKEHLAYARAQKRRKAVNLRSQVEEHESILSKWGSTLPAVVDRDYFDVQMDELRSQVVDEVAREAKENSVRFSKVVEQLERYGNRTGNKRIRPEATDMELDDDSSDDEETLPPKKRKVPDTTKYVPPGAPVGRSDSNATMDVTGAFRKTATVALLCATLYVANRVVNSSKDNLMASIFGETPMDIV